LVEGVEAANVKIPSSRDAVDPTHLVVLPGEVAGLL
jgi:hypothetical protein